MLYAAALDLVDLLRQRVDLDPQPARRLVHQVDRLVGKEAVADVAVRQGRRRHERVVRDAYAVVHFVALFQAAQDRDRVLDRRLAHVHRLEPPLQRRVLFHVLAVLVERRRADDVQLAPRERRLEQVRGVHGALGAPRSHERVQLVDEHDVAPLGGRDLLDHGLEALLELAAVLGARDQRAQVERDQVLVPQRVGDVPVHDALRQSFHDRGLPDAGLADQHGVVLGTARQHLHDAADLLVPADHRVELRLAGLLGEIAREPLERLILLLRLLVGHAMGAAHAFERCQQVVVAHARRRQQLPGRRALQVRQGEQQVLGRDVGVAQRLGLRLGTVERLAHLAR